MGINGKAYADGKQRSHAIIGNAVADASRHLVGRLCVCFWQDNCKLVAAVARRRIDVPAEAQNIGHPAERMAPRQMPVAVVDLLQSIQVKQQQGKLSPRALGTLDFHIEHFGKMAVVGQSCQWVESGLLTEMILQLALFGDILSDDLIAVQLALLINDFLSAAPDLQGCAVLPLPFYFDGVDWTLRVWLPQQLRASHRILNKITRKVYTQQFLS